MAPTEPEKPSVGRGVAGPVAVGLGLWLSAHVLLAVPWAQAGDGYHHPWALAVVWVLRCGGAVVVLLGAVHLARRLVRQLSEAPSSAPRARRRAQPATLAGTGLALMAAYDLFEVFVRPGETFHAAHLLLLLAGYAGTPLLALGVFGALRQLEDQLGGASVGSTAEQAPDR